MARTAHLVAWAARLMAWKLISVQALGGAMAPQDRCLGAAGGGQRLLLVVTNTVSIFRAGWRWFVEAVLPAAPTTPSLQINL